MLSASLNKTFPPFLSGLGRLCASGPLFALQPVVGYASFLRRQGALLDEVRPVDASGEINSGCEINTVRSIVGVRSIVSGEINSGCEINTVRSLGGPLQAAPPRPPPGSL